MIKYIFLFLLSGCFVSVVDDTIENACAAGYKQFRESSKICSSRDFVDIQAWHCFLYQCDGINYYSAEGQQCYKECRERVISLKEDHCDYTRAYRHDCRNIVEYMYTRYGEIANEL